jgi:ATP-dependent Lon protease
MATDATTDPTTDPTRPYPSDLPALALRETVVFPLTLQPLAIARPVSIEAVNRALASDRLIFLSLQTTDRADPEPGDLKPIGTIAAIRQMAKAPTGGIHVVVEGLARARATISSSAQPRCRVASHRKCKRSSSGSKIRFDWRMCSPVCWISKGWKNNSCSRTTR